MEGNESYRLVVRRGPQPNQTYELNKDLITLGRDITNDIVINDPEVSRHHLRLTRGERGYTIEDLGSTNGTFINGQRLSGIRPLNNGDLIGLGETVTLGYELVRAPQAGAPQQYQPPPATQTPKAAAPGSPPPAAQPSAESQQSAAPQDPYVAPSPPPAAQQQPPYEAAGYEAAPPPQAPYGAPPQQQYPPGYDYYDPYGVREEPSNTMRWILIGCVGLTLVCCCTIIAGLVIIDGADLWCDIPVFKDVVTPLVFNIGRALGMITGTGVCP